MKEAHLPTKSIGRCAFLFDNALKIPAAGAERKLKYFPMTRGIIRDVPRKS